MLEHWKAWIADFDRCVDDDQWDRLAPYLADNVIYSVSGAPVACTLYGRDAVIAGFARSIANFDRKLGSREWIGLGVRVHEPDAITCRAMVIYRAEGFPPITFGAQGLWVFRDGKIAVMTDLYDAEEKDVQAALAMLEQSSGDIDASYV